MSDIEEVVTVESTGLNNWLIDQIGWDNYVELCRQFGGQKVYIPKKPYNEIRNREIRRQFNSIMYQADEPDRGVIYRSLARKFGITERGIRHVLFD